MITTIVFDLDDTLYMEREFVISGFRAVDAWLSENRGVRHFFPAAWKAYSLGVRGNIFNIAFDLMGIRDPWLINDCVRVYRDHKPQISILPEAQEVIDFYKDNKNLAIITDGLASVQGGKVAALNLPAMIPHIILTGALGEGMGKPHPAAYENVMQHYGVEGMNCVYIGDNPNKDFITARQLGWQTIRIRRPHSEHGYLSLCKEKEADISISHLLEIKGIIPA